MSLKDFQILNKLGTNHIIFHLITCFIGEGAYSSVYKVKRMSDKLDYALKKVTLADLT